MKADFMVQPTRDPARRAASGGLTISAEVVSLPVGEAREFPTIPHHKIKEAP